LSTVIQGDPVREVKTTRWDYTNYLNHVSDRCLFSHVITNQLVNCTVTLMYMDLAPKTF